MIFIRNNYYLFMYKLLGGSVGLFTISNYYKGSEKFYDNFLMPIVNIFGIENARKLVFVASKLSLVPKSPYKDPNILSIKNQHGFTVSNPIGIAADFDSQGDFIEPLLDIGYGFVEIKPDCSDWDMYDKPRRHFNFFRNSYDNDLKLTDINNMAFKQIQKLRNKSSFQGTIGINLSTNDNYSLKTYVNGLKIFGYVADYVVIEYDNLVRNKIQLETALTQLVEIRNRLNINKKPLIFLKLPIITTSNERKQIASVINQTKCHVNGLIIPLTNRTTERIQYVSKNFYRRSPPTIYDNHINIISDMYQLTNGNILIIGDGGVTSGEEAYKKLKNGATCLQIYTPLIEHGPPRIVRIKKDLEQLLKQDGHTNITDVIGQNLHTHEKHYFPFY